MEKANKKIILRANSAMFSLELHDIALTIVGFDGLDAAIDKYCLGWCYAEDTSIPKIDPDIALLFEDEQGKKTWFHYFSHALKRQYDLEGFKTWQERDCAGNGF
jgi:hypothetical protein